MLSRATFVGAAIALLACGPKGHPDAPTAQHPRGDQPAPPAFGAPLCPKGTEATYTPAEGSPPPGRRQPGTCAQSAPCSDWRSALSTAHRAEEWACKGPEGTRHGPFLRRHRWATAATEAGEFREGRVSGLVRHWTPDGRIAAVASPAVLWNVDFAPAPTHTPGPGAARAFIAGTPELRVVRIEAHDMPPIQLVDTPRGADFQQPSAGSTEAAVSESGDWQIAREPPRDAKSSSVGLELRSSESPAHCLRVRIPEKHQPTVHAECLTIDVVGNRVWISQGDQKHVESSVLALSGPSPVALDISWR